MNPVVSIALLSLTSVLPAWAEGFAPPQAYPTERYEAVWQKNPFTLKTAPPAVVTESFAKDLALGGISKDEEGTRVVLVNVKTHDRKKYYDQKEGHEGIRVAEVHLGESHRDSFVRVEKGSESATLRYDEALLKQLASLAGTPKIQGQPHPGATPPPGGAPLTAPSGTPMPVPAVAPNPNTTSSAAPPKAAPIVQPRQQVQPAVAQNNAAGAPAASAPQRRRLATLPNPGSPPPARQ